MTSVSKNVHIDKLDDIFNKYNNIYDSATKMKPVDVKSSTYFNCIKKTIEKNPKFKIIDIVRITKYKNIFAKDYPPNWSEEVFMIEEVKNTAPWTYVINNINGQEII